MAFVTLAQVRLTVVEGAGLDGGRLHEDPAGAAVTVALAADRTRFEKFLLERLRLGAPRTRPFTEVGSVTVTGGPAPARRSWTRRRRQPA
ncbi:MAG: hypothetical protein HYX55_04715 [Chloroflexi bacterium]|nr:hypothetical protein [Chloroflexota bacterium]